MSWLFLRTLLLGLFLLPPGNHGDTGFDGSMMEIPGGGLHLPDPRMMNFFDAFRFPGPPVGADFMLHKGPNISMPKMRVPHPPMAPSHVLMPRLPIGMVNFPSNKSFAGPKTVTLPNGRRVNFEPPGYVSVNKNAPLEFVRAPNWTFDHPPMAPTALGVSIKGSRVGAGHKGAIADPIHMLPENHLFVPVAISPPGIPDGKFTIYMNN